MKTVQIAGLPIAYADEGHGPPILLAHCSSGSHKMWSGLMRELVHGHRVLAPDLIGYGQSARWPEGRPYEPDADPQLLAALMAEANEPVHLVGHSYGAAMALEAARAAPERVKALTLIEPVSFHLLRAGGAEAEARIVEGVVERVTAAMRKGDRQAAASAYMGFWIGRLRWWFAPRKLRRSVIETVEKVAMEFDAIEHKTVGSLDPYRIVSAPTLILVGEKTRAPAKAVATILEETLPTARVEAIAGAGHMSPFTHRDEVNRRILAHVREVEAAGR